MVVVFQTPKVRPSTSLCMSEKEDGKEPISNIILQTSSVGGYDQASLVGHGMLWCHLVIKTGSEPKLLATMVIISS